MPLDPMIAAMLEAMPDHPDKHAMDIVSYRAAVNAMTARMPRYELPLAAIEDRTIDADGVALKVRIYTPVGQGSFPLFVYYHGGGFTIGDLDMCDPICRALASGAGCVLVSVDYRLAPEHPYPIPNDDCWAALRWAQANAASIGADAARIAVGGDSAGATLASSMALRARAAGLPLAAQVLMYGIHDYDAEGDSYRSHADGPVLTLDDIHFYWDHYLPEGVDRTSPDAAPLHAKDLGGLPPAFVATAELDPSHSAGEAYGHALDKAGVPTVIRRHPGMPHGFYSLVALVPAARAAMDVLCDWLRRQLA